MPDGITLLRDGSIVTPHRHIASGFLAIRGDRILCLGEMSSISSIGHPAAAEIDCGGLAVLPGFIDIHTHGADDIDVTGSPDRIGELSRCKAATGVTGYLPTFFSALHFNDLLAAIEAASRSILGVRETSGALPLGINLETPFLHPKLGAHTGEFDVKPEIGKVEQILARGRGCVKIVTIAPELEGALDAITCLREKGVVCSIGHSLAEPELLAQAIERGAHLATHLLNGTFPLAAREPGVVPVGLNEYLLVRDDVLAECIADERGAHVHPVMLTVLHRCKGIDRLILVTDSLFTAGLPAGDYELKDGRTVHSDGFVNRLPNGHLAGSAMILNRSLAAFMRHTGIPLSEAVKTVTINPARLLGIEHSTGTLEAGKEADIAVVDGQLDVRMTIARGKLVYERPANPARQSP